VCRVGARGVNGRRLACAAATREQAARGRGTARERERDTTEPRAQPRRTDPRHNSARAAAVRSDRSAAHGRPPQMRRRAPSSVRPSGRQVGRAVLPERACRAPTRAERRQGHWLAASCCHRCQVVRVPELWAEGLGLAWQLAAAGRAAGVSIALRGRRTRDHAWP
jgi:hypothetical protein